MPTNMEIEGKFETVLYSRVERKTDGATSFIFETENSGSNTARSAMNMFEDGKIPNDYNLILEKLAEY